MLAQREILWVSTIYPFSFLCMKYLWFFFLLVGISIALKIFLFPVHVIDSVGNTAYDAVSKTINADNAIYNYEWFKSRYEEIQATKNQLVNTRESLDSFLASAWERKMWTFEDKIEHSRLNTVYLGQKNYLESIIAEYNARGKMANRAMFSDGILPNIIEATTFILK